MKKNKGHLKTALLAALLLQLSAGWIYAGEGGNNAEAEPASSAAAPRPQTEYFLNLMPLYLQPLNDPLLRFGWGLSFEAEIRPRPFLGVFVRGEYQNLSVNTLSPLSIWKGSVGVGYNHHFGNRLSLCADVFAGLYRVTEGPVNSSGVSAGLRLSLKYKVHPAISAGAAAGYGHYMSNFANILYAGPSLSFNVRELFNNEARVQMRIVQASPVFPVLYSWYEENSFAEVEIINKEPNAIKGLRVYFFQESYMDEPMLCGESAILEKDGAFPVELRAFFNERIMELLERSDTAGTVIVEYRSLGKKYRRELPLDIPLYHRNALSWADDRRASVFVSSRDTAVMGFSKYVHSAIRRSTDSRVSRDMQYAMALFETLRLYGMHYIIDPSSAYENMVGTDAVDFLQFPYQTLLYRGGDCDDLSILSCALMESAGIDTAFITIPGHIYMAFSPGLEAGEAKRLMNESAFILQDGKVWIPLEITLLRENFMKAWQVGAQEWKKAGGEARLYPLKECREHYQPVNVPQTATLTLPAREDIAGTFEEILRQLPKGQAGE